MTYKYFAETDDILVPIKYEFCKINDINVLDTFNKYHKFLNDIIMIDSRCFKTIFYLAAINKKLIIYNTQNNTLCSFLYYINIYYFNQNKYIITNYELALNCYFTEMLCKLIFKHLSIQFNIKDYKNIFKLQSYTIDNYIPTYYIYLNYIKDYILLKKNSLPLLKTHSYKKINIHSLIVPNNYGTLSDYSILNLIDGINEELYKHNKIIIYF